MNAILTWIDYWNRQVKKFTILDLKLAQLWAIGFVLIVVKIFPQIMELSVFWFVAMMLVCAPRLGYVLFLKEDKDSHRAGSAGALRTEA